MSSQAAELLSRILGELTELSDRVQIAMADATEALLKADVSLAEDVLTADESIATLATHIELKASEVLTYPDLPATQTDLAKSAIQIASSLAQMGKSASQIAIQTRLGFPEQLIPLDLHPAVKKMSQMGMRIIDWASNAMVNPDSFTAAEMQSEATFKHEIDPNHLANQVGHHYEQFATQAISVAANVKNLIAAGVFELPSNLNSGGLAK